MGSASQALRTPCVPEAAMLEVEVFGTGLAPGAPPVELITRLCVLAAASAGVFEGHLAIEFVDADRITRFNAEHRDREEPTDVLSFPIDEVEPLAGGGSDRGGAEEGERSDTIPRELGDVVICPEHTSDLREAIVHGVLHLVGMDHETDDGEMLRLQRELLVRESR
jgi:probable rRNA maturation factor